jgi:predicted RecB family endonuclease
MIAARKRAEAAHRRTEDLGIAVDILLRSVPAIDDLIAALDGAGGSVRLVGALRAELARRRSGGRR